MANSPEQPESARPPKRDATKRDATKRDPAQHSKKDPAKPTRAKASRPDSAPTDPALAELLNPGIRQGTAGIGSGTGLQPPPDNSWDRRADFSKAHTARHSTRQGNKGAFKEAPQTGYVAKNPVVIPIPPGELDPDLAKALGLDDDAAPPSGEAAGAPVLRGKHGENLGVAATAHALES